MKVCRRGGPFALRLAPLVLVALVGAPSAGAEADASVAGAPAVAPSACAAGAAEAAARRIQSRYDAIRDLRADFEQQSRSATFAGQPVMDGEPKQGRVVFAKPGKMRWTYAAPDPSVVVSDGETLWIHDVEARTATRLAVTQEYLSGAALQFLLGDGRLLDEFHVRATACESGRIELDLTPRKDASYERLGLVADPASGDIAATSVVDLFGNRTEIRFRNVEVNLDPGKATFEFELPQGVELIDYSEAATSTSARPLALSRPQGLVLPQQGGSRFASWHPRGGVCGRMWRDLDDFV